MEHAFQACRITQRQELSFRAWWLSKQPENPERRRRGIMIAQHVAKPGPPIRASFARIGVGSGVLGLVGKVPESPGDDTVLTQTLKWCSTPCIKSQAVLEAGQQLVLLFLGKERRPEGIPRQFAKLSLAETE